VRREEAQLRSFDCTLWRKKVAGRGLIRRCSAYQRKEAATSPLSASSHGLLITASTLELLAAVRPTAFTIGNCTSPGNCRELLTAQLICWSLFSCRPNSNRSDGNNSDSIAVFSLILCAQVNFQTREQTVELGICQNEASSDGWHMDASRRNIHFRVR